MGIISVVRTIKDIHKEDIILVKIGKLYYSFGKDAYIMAYIHKYKLKQVEKNIHSCAFPTTSINKIMADLENKELIIL